MNISKKLALFFRSSSFVRFHKTIKFTKKHFNLIGQKGISPRTIAFTAIDCLDSFIDSNNEIKTRDLYTEDLWDVLIEYKQNLYTIQQNILDVLDNNFEIDKNTSFSRTNSKEIIEYVEYKISKDIKIAIQCIKLENRKIIAKDCMNLVLVTKNKSEEAKNIIKEKLWDSYKTSNLKLKYHYNYHGDGWTTTITNDNSIKPIKSDKAIEIANRVKKALDKGLSRSILLYGTTGTGKSTIGREISRLLNFRSLKILKGGEAIANTFIDLYKPEVIIFDDIDRNCTDEFLDFLEDLKKSCKIIIGSANYIDKLDPALIRPGRFDEIIKIERLDDDVIKNVLGDLYTKETFNLVCDWPIAFIQEYVNRCKFMSKEETDNQIGKELEIRVLQSKIPPKTIEEEIKAEIKAEMVKETKAITTVAATETKVASNIIPITTKKKTVAKSTKSKKPKKRTISAAE